MDDEFVERVVDIYIRRKSDWIEDVSVFHNQLMDKMLEIPGPFGFLGAERQKAPIFAFDRSGEMNTHKCYNVRNRMRGVRFIGCYTIPESRSIYGRNPLASPPATIETWNEIYYMDYNLHYEWKLTNKKIDYHFALHQNLPEVIEVFEARFVTVDTCFYSIGYQEGWHISNGGANDEYGNRLELNETYNRLKADPAIDVDGWNNIYTLYPAQFWEGGRCHRALGYGPDEVIRRLSGKVPLVRPLCDGVYIVLNDNPDIIYDEYYAMNVGNKAILGLE